MMKLETAIERVFNLCNLAGEEADIYKTMNRYKVIRELNEAEYEALYEEIADRLGFSSYGEDKEPVEEPVKEEASSFKSICISEARYYKMLETYDKTINELEDLKAQLEASKHEEVFINGLRSCPFCGQTAEERTPEGKVNYNAVRVFETVEPATYGLPQETRNKMYYVKCGNCFTRSGNAVAGFNPLTETEVTPEEAKQIAINKWNRRAGAEHERTNSK